MQEYGNVLRWVGQIAGREAVQRGRIVNRGEADDPTKVPERHGAEDIDKALAAKAEG